MIIYATKQTRERYKLKTPDELEDPLVRAVVKNTCEREQGDRLLEWGAKLFYFDRRKCIQFSNFASKLTIVTVDVKMSDLENVGNLIAMYMMDIYSENRKMKSLLERLFDEHPVCCFSKLSDKSMIATLNHTQTYCLDDGYRLYDYIKNNILQTKQFNRYLNIRYLFTERIDGEISYFHPAEKFEQLLRERYKK